MKNLLIFIYVVTFITSGVVMYLNSDKVVTDSFVVVEKNKEDLQFGYLENKLHKTFDVTAEDFIKYDIGDTYKIKQYSITFIVAAIVLVVCIIILIVILGGDGIDLSDLLEALV